MGAFFWWSGGGRGLEGRGRAGGLAGGGGTKEFRDAHNASLPALGLGGLADG